MRQHLTDHGFRADAKLMLQAIDARLRSQEQTEGEETTLRDARAFLASVALGSSPEVQTEGARLAAEALPQFARYSPGMKRRAASQIMNFMVRQAD